MCRVQGRNEISECVPVRRLVEAAERCIPLYIDVVGELRSRLLGQICNSCKVVFVPGFECVLDALVEFLIAAGCFDSPEVAAADDGRILGVEVESEVDLVECAQIKVLRVARVSYIITSLNASRASRASSTHLHCVGSDSLLSP